MGKRALSGRDELSECQLATWGKSQPGRYKYTTSKASLLQRVCSSLSKMYFFLRSPGSEKTCFASFVPFLSTLSGAQQPVFYFPTVHCLYVLILCI